MPLRPFSHNSIRTGAKQPNKAGNSTQEEGEGNAGKNYDFYFFGNHSIPFSNSYRNINKFFFIVQYPVETSFHNFHDYYFP